MSATSKRAVRKTTRNIRKHESILLKEVGTTPERIERVQRIAVLAQALSSGNHSKFSNERKEYDRLIKELLVVRIEIIQNRLDDTENTDDHREHLIALKARYEALYK